MGKNSYKITFYFYCTRSSALCVKRFKGLSKSNTKIPVIIQKINIPVKICFSPAVSAKPPMLAASLLPSPVAAQYRPMIEAAYLTGASLVIKERETGEAHNSPMV